jgi:hypothetical protein
MSENAELESKLPIDQLSDAELEVLAGLLLAMAQADEELSPEESSVLKRVASSVGRDRFMTAANAAKPRFASLSLANLEQLVTPVRVQASRDLIFFIVRDLAFGDGLIAEEGQLLNKLAELWQVEWSESV